MLADIVVLSDDLFTIAPEQIEKVKVDLTIFDGRIIYDRTSSVARYAGSFLTRPRSPG